jgi:hypothetical protein
MRRLIYVLFAALYSGLFCGLAVAEAENEYFAALPAWFSPEIYAAGQWNAHETMVNRADVRFRFHFEDVSPLLDFRLRGQVIDSRPADAPGESGRTVPAAGIYHSTTASRVLYGPLAVKGLPARVRSVWLRGAPFIIAREPASADLRTEPVQSALPSFYGQIATPQLFGFSAFTAFTSGAVFGTETALDAGLPCTLDGFTTGAEMRFTKKTKLSAAFYRQTLTLPPRKADGWFSEKTALPQRDSRLFAGTLLFESPYFGLGGDAAYSETFAFGRGLYWNAAGQAGSRPFRLSLAADQTTPHFVDSQGAISGMGFRTAARFEWFRPRGELWRVQTTLRGFSTEDEGFTRSASSIYYRFPAARDAALSFSRISLSASRNASDPEKILDAWDAVLGVNLGKIRTTWTVSLDEYTKDNNPLPVPDPRNVYVLEEWKLSAQAAFTLLFCSITAKIGIVNNLDAVSAEWKDAEFPFSISVQMHSGPGRLTLKAASARLPEDWTAGVSWRLRYP